MSQLKKNRQLQLFIFIIFLSINVIVSILNQEKINIESKNYSKFLITLFYIIQNQIN